MGERLGIGIILLDARRGYTHENASDEADLLLARFAFFQYLSSCHSANYLREMPRMHSSYGAGASSESWPERNCVDSIH